MYTRSLQMLHETKNLRSRNFIINIKIDEIKTTFLREERKSLFTLLILQDRY